MKLNKKNCRLSKDGSLEITLDRYTGVCIARIVPWKKGCSLKIEKGSRYDFLFLDYEPALIPLEGYKKDQLPIERYFSAMPEKVLFIARQQYFLQFLYIRVLVQCSAAIDLYESNKYLFQLLLFHHQSISEIRKLLRLPQKDLLKKLYPVNQSIFSYKSVSRILKNKLLSAQHPRQVEYIDYFLNKLFNGNVPFRNEASLLHLKNIPIIGLNEEHLKYTFLFRHRVLFDRVDTIMDGDAHVRTKRKISEINRLFESAFSLMTDSLMMAVVLCVEYNKLEKSLLNTESYEQLELKHDLIMEQVENINRGEQLRNIPDILSIEPPLPETENIKALRSYDEFKKESSELRHCLSSASYIRRVAQGESYVYSIRTNTDHCTIELAIEDGGRFYNVRQICGYRNKKPLDETREMVEQWLISH